MPIVKWCFGLVLGELVEDRLHHRRRELLRRQTVAAGDDARWRGERRDAFRLRFGERGRHVEIERIAGCARLLRPIEHGEAADALRQRRQERGARERAIEPDLQHADLLAARGQGSTVSCTVSAPDPMSTITRSARRVADVLEQAVAPAGHARRTPSSCARRRPGRRRRSGSRLTRLKEDVGVLGGSAQHRPIGRQRRGCGGR